MNALRFRLQFSRSWPLLAIALTVLYGFALLFLGAYKPLEILGILAVLSVLAWGSASIFRISQAMVASIEQRSLSYFAVGILLWMTAFGIRGTASTILSIDLGLPSIVDLLRIAGSLAILVALGVFPARRERGFGRIRAWLDLGLLVLGAGTLYWLVFFRSFFLIGIANPIPAFWSQIYGGFGLIFLSLCLRIILLRSDGQERTAFYAISAAFVFFTIADLNEGYQILQGFSQELGIVVPARILGGLFLVFSTNYLLGKWPVKKYRYLSLRTRITGRQVEALLPYVFAYAVVGFILVNWWLTSGEVDWFSIRAAILMVVLLIARQGVVIGQSELRRYAELVNAATDFAFISTSEGEIRLTNPSFRKALHLVDDEPLPNLRELVATGSSLDTVLSIAAVSGWTGEIGYLGKDGSSFPGSLSLIPIHDDRQQDQLFAATGFDLTQVKLRESELRTAYDHLSSAQHELETLNTELEKKVDIRTQELKEMVAHLDQLNKELQALDELKTEFVALVSHELRAPLTTIGTGLEVLLQSRPELDDRTRETIQLITEETARLAGFVETILDISSLEAGRFPIEMRPLSLPDLVREVCQQVVFDEAIDRIEIEIPQDFPPLVADEQGVRSVLYHVLDNAVKYAPEGPVKLKITEHDGSISITVRDHGPGIPDSQRGRVFEMFYRIDSSDSREVYGRGLGLTLAKRYLDVMGGSIEILDPGERGTLVRIELPQGR